MNTGLPNPASVYCEEQGGKLEIRENENGQYGVCLFEDGSECDEWAYYRGECAPGCPQALSEPSVGCILRSYPIWIDEERVTVSPRQLRYLYGYMLYAQGVPDAVILKHLGYAQPQGIRSLFRSHLLPEQAVLRRKASL